MQTKKLLFIAMIICLSSQMLHGQYIEFMYDGIVREYALVEPSLDPDPNGYPLVIGLHGAGSEGIAMIGTAFTATEAKIDKFIMASPNSLRYPLMAWWNAGDGYEALADSTDDLGFISALIDTMIMNYNVDTTRIYLLAHSNGSMMAYRVAAEMSHRIAAIATNTGQMVYEYCNPEYPVPIIHFHGLEDPICPYEGMENEQVVIPPVDSVMAIWREINDCSSIPDTILNDTRIIGKKWVSSSGKSDIILYTIENWGHKWPRTVDTGIDATNLMLDFLLLHTRTIETSIKENEIQSMPKNFELYQNYPNPFNPSTIIKYRLTKSSFIVLKVYNLVGQEIDVLVNGFQSAGEHEITWLPKNLSSGIYCYKLQAGEFSEIRKLILHK